VANGREKPVEQPELRVAAPHHDGPLGSSGAAPESASAAVAEAAGDDEARSGATAAEPAGSATAPSGAEWPGTTTEPPRTRSSRWEGTFRTLRSFATTDKSEKSDLYGGAESAGGNLDDRNAAIGDPGRNAASGDRDRNAASGDRDRNAAVPERDTAGGAPDRQAAVAEPGGEGADRATDAGPLGEEAGGKPGEKTPSESLASKAAGAAPSDKTANGEPGTKPAGGDTATDFSEQTTSARSASKPADGTASDNAANGKPDSKAAGGGTEGKPGDSAAGGKTDDSPASGRTDDSQAGGRTGDNPASGKTGDTPASGKTGDTPASGKTGDNPASGKTGEGAAGGKAGGGAAGGKVRRLRRASPMRVVRYAGRNTSAWAKRPSGRLILPAIIAVVLVGAAGTAGAYLVPKALQSAPSPSVTPGFGLDATAGSAAGNLPTGSAPAGPGGLPATTGPLMPAQNGARPADALVGWAQQVGTKVGIPVVAVEAYGYAELVVARTMPTCHLSWTTLAAIGKVESSHGSANGSVLGADGMVQPPIYGLPLDGKGGRVLVRDTDQGTIDGDPTYDLAVGPMQFIPSVWLANKVDADNNGVADPNDIDDASLTAADYLCRGGRDMSKADSWWDGILSYNALRPYAQKVFDAANDYGQRSRA
jgi:hypothetical protein